MAGSDTQVIVPGCVVRDPDLKTMDYICSLKFSILMYGKRLVDGRYLPTCQSPIK